MLFHNIEFDPQDSFHGKRRGYQHWRATLDIDGWTVRIDCYGEDLTAHSKFSFNAHKDGVYVNARQLGSKQMKYLVLNFHDHPPTNWIEIRNSFWDDGPAPRWIAERVTYAPAPWQGVQKGRNDRILISTIGWTDADRMAFKLEFD